MAERGEGRGRERKRGSVQSAFRRTRMIRGPKRKGFLENGLFSVDDDDGRSAGAGIDFQSFNNEALFAAATSSFRGARAALGRRAANELLHRRLETLSF